METVRRLRTLLRPADTVARLGGDEFVVVCEGNGYVGFDPGTMSEVLVRRLTRRLRQSVETENGVLSIGVAVGSGSCTAAELLSRADEAMYEVKRASRAAALR